MKILMVSMFSPHFFNWTEQLKDSGHEIYWLDVFDSNTQVIKIDFVHQIKGWRYRVNFPGRYLIKEKLPVLHHIINSFNERKLQDVLRKKIKEIKPDAVHSFAMHISCFPIFEVMKKNPEIKWVYSSWGSDLYFYQNKNEFEKVKLILPYLHYMFSDCRRDVDIATNNGFRGEVLGVFPGRGGFDFTEYKELTKEFKNRKIILVKGYQGKHGKCIEVLLALNLIANKLNSSQIVVVGADKEVLDFVKNYNIQDSVRNLKVLGKIPYVELMSLMGKSIIYIGNSSSDGIPNTLLEAIVMETFPMQSNPGSATAEIIKHGKNGFLINDPQDKDEIAALILKALENPQLLQSAINFNNQHVKPKLEREYLKKQVLEKYCLIEENL